MKKRLWRNWLLMALGFCVMALPYLGFPRRTEEILLSIAGFAVALLSFLLARQNARELENSAYTIQ